MLVDGLDTTLHMPELGQLTIGNTTFLNMWLEKFVFCELTLRPTTNQQGLAEKLADATEIPLGKYLLGATFSLLHQVSVNLSAREPIGNIGGPGGLYNFG